MQRIDRRARTAYGEERMGCLRERKRDGLKDEGEEGGGEEERERERERASEHEASRTVKQPRAAL